MNRNWLFLSNFGIKTAGILLLTVSMSACTSKCSKDKDAEDMEEISLADNDLDEISKAKKIFYSLPSPLETAKLIKDAGAKYSESLLNSPDNVSLYTTNKSMALNLGIYTTDMSFASLCDQTQATINYMNVTKKLAEGLGILDAIDDKTIKKLEANINNREVIMDLISETFYSTSAYLKENEREPIATIVLIGGWVEGLYIATQMVGDSPIDNNKLVDRIVEQRLSWDILEKLIEQSKKDPDVVALSAQLNDIRKVMKKIRIESNTSNEQVVNEGDVAVIKSDIKVGITPEIYRELKNTVKALRSNFII